MTRKTNTDAIIGVAVGCTVVALIRWVKTLSEDDIAKFLVKAEKAFKSL
jgi:hypothetical protein